MRVTTNLIALCVPFILAAGAEPPVESGDESAYLTPDHCFKTSPEDVLSELRVGCEACIDHTMSVYAERVRPLVDERCANVTAARKDVHDTIEQFDRAFQSVTDGNWFGHETSRHDAVVEWVLITIASQPFSWPHGRYDQADLRSIMMLWYKAHLSPDPADTHPTQEEFAQFVDVALSSLRHAEDHLTSDQSTQLRQILMHRLTRWL
jgi:hypothetical protein